MESEQSFDGLPIVDNGHHLFPIVGREAKEMRLMFRLEL